MNGIYYFQNPGESYNEGDVVKNKPLVGREVDNNFRYIDGNAVDHIVVEDGVLKVFLKKDGETPTFAVDLPEKTQAEEINRLKDVVYGTMTEHDHSETSNHDGLQERVQRIENVLGLNAGNPERNFTNIMAETVVNLFNSIKGDVDACIDPTSGCLVLYTKGYIADTKH